MLKKEVRKLYREKRMTLSEKERIKLDDLLLIQFQGADIPFLNSLLSYWPIEENHEPNTHLFTEFLRFRNPELKICYPVSDFSTGVMQAIATDIDTTFTKKELNLYEPDNDEVVPADRIDMVFVPLLAFDAQGYRVGYGRGFYDKYLAECRKDCLKVGFSYLSLLNRCMTAMNLTYLWTFVSLPKTSMFSNSFLKSFRILLLPFAIVYWVVISVRNWLYDQGIMRSTSFALPIICVGNLAVGGTGKSPMVEYLVELLKGRWKVATLSRGYKRKTRGYALAGERTTALEIGDEPMQFHVKFPDIAVAVGEERLVAIPQLLHDRPGTEVIILDDALQHRAIRAGLNILLTEYGNLFTRDFYLPAGDLRDLKSQYKRAGIIVVTKCDPSLTEEERQQIVHEIAPKKGQTVYFTTIRYGNCYHILDKKELDLNDSMDVLLVTGIANPRPLKSWLEANSKEYHLQQYSDHHIFSIDDLKEIRKRFEAIQSTDKIILTTEKDAVRLIKFSTEIKSWPLYVIPVRHDFLFRETEKFNQHITTFIRDFKK